ncbi:SRPBCC family protein [Gynurincola endophyticus]|jgi:ligand-binding SRPBCC domain-containing protein|uniref:SRPBCC family protein n=1 Tax=Gynurincola endophyticus TaxID=2479004 RepID=UPI000F8D3F33|nr:SRPBCC family protein [Gynurincola endophyticus]
MPFYQFTRIQPIPADINEVWNFISNPDNLARITPAYMDFKVTGNSGGENMYPGMVITYTIRPLLRIKLNWMTEITQVKPGKYFIDEQRIGPYKFWHHQHHIEEVDGGVLMTDIVTYAPPFGFIGAIANRLFIRKQLAAIFDFRRKFLEDNFGKFKK